VLDSAAESVPDRPPLVRFTLIRIARDLGVSLTTVSRALSGTGRIGGATRRRIQEYVEKLQRETAPALPACMHRMVGLFVPWYSRSYGMQTSIAAGAQEAVRAVCEEKGYAVVYSSFGRREQPTVADELLGCGALAGLILYRTRDEQAIAQELKGLPCIFVHRDLEGTGLNYVGIDFAEAMDLATGHCLELGFRELGLVCGNVSYPSHGGYRAAFLDTIERGGPPPGTPLGGGGRDLRRAGLQGCPENADEKGAARHHLL